MRREQLGAVPSTLTTDRLDVLHHLRAGQRRVGRGHLAGVGRAPGRRTRPGSRWCRRVSRSAVGQRLGLLRHAPCRRRRGSALLRTALASHGSDDEPSGTATSQATSSTATSETTAPPASSTPLQRPAGDRAAAAGCRASRRAPARARPARRSRPARPRPGSAPSANWLAISGPSCRPMQRAAEEAAERQRADDEALPVAADREHQHQQDQDPRRPRTPAQRTKWRTTRRGHGTTSSGAPPRAAGTGAVDRRQLVDPVRVPRPGPAGHVEQRRDHAGGEAPDQHAARPRTPGRSSRSGGAPAAGWPGRPARRPAAGRRARPRPASRGCTGCGACHQASTGVTTKSLTGIHSVGQLAPARSTLAGSSPTSSFASRSAVAAGVGVARVGRAAGEGRLAGVVAHAWRRAAGPAGRGRRRARSPSRTSTALARPPLGRAWRRRVKSSVRGGARPGSAAAPTRPAARRRRSRSGHRHAEVLLGPARRASASSSALRVVDVPDLAVARRRRA